LLYSYYGGVMMKKIRLKFLSEDVAAEAVLLEEKAPETCKLLWDALEKPFEGYAIHAMFTGRELSFGISPDRLDNKALSLPPENQTVFPIPGDLIWNGYYPYQWQGVPHPVYDFGIFYGRDSRLLLPVGWRPSNHFGIITENLQDFAKVCSLCQSEGKKLLRIERLG
jgi:hypothetical protein